MINILFTIIFIFVANSNASKVDELRAISERDGVINLNSTGYFYYTMEFPRPYDMVIYFTAPNCKLCDELLIEYKLVASFYQKNGALHAFKDEQSNKRAVFFAVMQFNEINQQVFTQLGFNSVPNLFVSQPQIIQVPQDEREFYLRELKWGITYTDGHVTAHKLLEYINKRTGRQIAYQPQIQEVLFMITVIVTFIAVVIILFRGFKQIFLNPQLLFVGQMVIYTVCLAGLVHNIIHGVPFTSIDAQGNIEWKAEGQRQQLGAEGFIMAICITFVGLTIILYHKLIHTPELQDSILKLSYLSLFGITFILIKFIEDIYREKGWYDPRFWPPENYIRGPLMRDQGNTI